MIIHLNDKPFSIKPGIYAGHLLQEIRAPREDELWVVDRHGLVSRLDTAALVARILPGDRLYLRKAPGGEGPAKNH